MKFKLCAVVIVMAMLTPAAHAEKLRAKGKGLNSDGSEFTAIGVYSPRANKHMFKVRRGLDGGEYSMCFSTDECTYTVKVTTGRNGRVKLKQSPLPDGFPDLMPGDILIVNDQDIDTYRLTDE